MKKLLTSLLALLTCFACATAVACGEEGNNSGSGSNTGSSNTGSDTGSTPDGEDELQDAVDYLEALYKEENVETRQDYEVLPAIMGFPITWTVDVETGVTVTVTDSGKVMVDVDELLDENLTYVLTATVADGDRTVSVSFTRTVLAAPSVIPVAITEAPVEGVAYKYHVYQSTLATDLYFAGGMAAIYYFSTTEDYTQAVDVYAEYVTDSTTDFYLYFVLDGVNQYLGVKVSADGAHDNIVYGTEKISTFVWNADLGTVTTHLEATKNGGGPNDFYFGNYSDKTTISCSYTSYAGGEGNNVGHLVTMVDKNSITPETKIAESKEGLNLSKTEYIGNATAELPIARHADVTVEWACESELVSIADGVLTITAPTEETTVTLTATLTCGEVSDTKEFTLTLKPAVSIPAADSTLTIPQANELGVAVGDNVYTEGKYYVSGVVSNVKDTKYGNLYIKDADGNEFYVYGVYSADGQTRYDAMETAPVVGDTITVYGVIGNYNGSPQMKNSWMTAYTAGEGSGTETPETPTLTTPEEILNALYALADGESLSGEFTLTGTITALDSYNNPTIVVEGFEDKPVYCYKLTVTNVVGDTITVTAGSMKNYGGTYEFTNCTLVTEDSGSTDTPVETPVEGAVTISIADVAAANSWANGTCYASVTYNGVTLTTAGTAVGSWGLNTGKYYDTNKDWRVYQNESGTLTITAQEGKTIASVKITYNNKNGGVILFNETQVTSATVMTVNANSLTIGVGSSTGAANGNIQITSIEIVYAE